MGLVNPWPLLYVAVDAVNVGTLGQFLFGAFVLQPTYGRVLFTSHEMQARD